MRNNLSLCSNANKVYEIFSKEVRNLERRIERSEKKNKEQNTRASDIIQAHELAISKINKAIDWLDDKITNLNGSASYHIRRLAEVDKKVIGISIKTDQLNKKINDHKHIECHICKKTIGDSWDGLDDDVHIQFSQEDLKTVIRSLESETSIYSTIVNKFINRLKENIRA